jgi:hypothetical protein
MPHPLNSPHSGIRRNGALQPLRSKSALASAAPVRNQRSGHPLQRELRKGFPEAGPRRPRTRYSPRCLRRRKC